MTAAPWPISEPVRYFWITLVLVAAVLAAWRFVGPAPPGPAPRTLKELDPLVAEVVARSLDAARSNRRNHEMRMRLCMVYEANALGDLALTCYEQAAKLRPRDAKVWYRLAMVREDRAEMDAAIDAMRRSIALDGDYAASHWRLGQWLLEAGELDEAEAAFRRAIDIRSGERAAWFGLAQLYLHRGEPEKAITLINDRLLTGREAAFAQHLLASAYRRAGRYDEANRAARLGPRLGARTAPEPPIWVDPWQQELNSYRTGYDAMRKHAEGLVTAGRYAEAIEPLERVRAGAPIADEDAPLLTLLGVAYVASGQTERGLRTLREAVEIDPNNFSARINLARAYYRTADGGTASLSMAELEARRAAEVAPQAAEPWQMLGLIETARGNLDEAVAAYQRAFELDARDVRALLEAAILLVRLERHEEAIDACLRVLRHEPDAGDAHVVMAMSFIALERWDEAESALAEAGRLDITNDALLLDTERQLAESMHRGDARQGE